MPEEYEGKDQRLKIREKIIVKKFTSDEAARSQEPYETKSSEEA